MQNVDLLFDQSDFCENRHLSCTSFMQSIAEQRRELYEFCEKEQLRSHHQQIKKYLSASAADEHLLQQSIQNYANQFCFPLQVHDSQVASPHRIYPVRRVGHIEPTASYFTAQYASQQVMQVLIEPLDNAALNYCAMVDSRNGNAVVEGVYCISHDHGVLQELFSYRPFADEVMEDLEIFAKIIVRAFDIEASQFSIYFESNNSSFKFSHIDLALTPALLVHGLAKERLLNNSDREAKLIAAKFIYEKTVLTDAEQLDLLNKASCSHNLVHFALDNHQQQIDKPFGVTIACDKDVRHALRGCIRVENVLKGRLRQF